MDVAQIFANLSALSTNQLKRNLRGLQRKISQQHSIPPDRHFQAALTRRVTMGEVQGDSTIYTWFRLNFVLKRRKNARIAPALALFMERSQMVLEQNRQEVLRESTRLQQYDFHGDFS
jgi:hypothetical protein